MEAERSRLLAAPPPLPNAAALAREQQSQQAQRLSALQAQVAAGADAAALKRAGYKASELRGADFDLNALWDAGYSVPALREAGFSARTVKDKRIVARRAAFARGEAARVHPKHPATAPPYGHANAGTSGGGAANRAAPRAPSAVQKPKPSSSLVGAGVAGGAGQSASPPGARPSPPGARPKLVKQRRGSASSLASLGSSASLASSAAGRCASPATGRSGQGTTRQNKKHAHGRIAHGHTVHV